MAQEASSDLLRDAQLLEKRFYPRVEGFSRTLAWKLLTLDEGNTQACLGAPECGGTTGGPTAHNEYVCARS